MNLEQKKTEAERLWPTITNQCQLEELLEWLDEWTRDKDPQQEGIRGLKRAIMDHLQERLRQCPLAELASALSEVIASEVIKALRDKLDQPREKGDSFAV